MMSSSIASYTEWVKHFQSMSANQPKSHSLAQLLQSESGGLKHVLQKAQQFQLLSQTLHHLLPSALKDQVLVLNYQSGILKLGISNQATAAKLRFQLSDLISQLRQMPQWYDLITIKPIVISASSNEALDKPKPTSEPLLLSGHVKTLLQEHIAATDDEAWRESLLRFLKHHT